MEEYKKKIVWLKEWTPKCPCVTSAGDFLVSIYNDDKTQPEL